MKIRWRNSVAMRGYSRLLCASWRWLVSTEEKAILYRKVRSKSKAILLLSSSIQWTSLASRIFSPVSRTQNCPQRQKVIIILYPDHQHHSWPSSFFLLSVTWFFFSLITAIYTRSSCDEKRFEEKKPRQNQCIEMRKFIFQGDSCQSELTCWQYIHYWYYA